jgi:hypothetical protein
VTTKAFVVTVPFQPEEGRWAAQQHQEADSIRCRATGQRGWLEASQTFS